jgi:hypothetical protein
MPWPLDSGFGPRCLATNAGLPAGTPDHQLLPEQIAPRVMSSLHIRCAAAGSRTAAADTPRVDGLERSSGRNASPNGITPSDILSPARSQPGSWTEVSLGARAHTIRSIRQVANRPP